MEDVDLSPILCLRRQEMFFHLLYLGLSVDEMANNRKTRELELNVEIVTF